MKIKISVGQKDSYKNKFVKTLIVHIAYNFYVKQMDPPRLIILFGIKDILNPINLLAIAEDYFIQMFSLKNKTEEKNFEKEKFNFFAFLKKCISLFLITSFNDIKQIIEDFHKKESINNSNLMDNISNDAYKDEFQANSNDFYNKKEGKIKETFLFFLYLSKLDNNTYSKQKEEGFEKSATQTFFNDFAYLNEKGNFVSFFLEDLKIYNSKLNFKKSSYMYHMDTILLFEKNSQKKSLKLMCLKSNMLSEYEIEDFPINDYFSLCNIINV